MSLLDQQIKLMDASLSELEKLKKEVGRLEQIRKDIEETRKGVESIPKELMDTFEKVKILSSSFVESLGKATTNYLDGSNTLFTSMLNELASNINVLEKVVEQLALIDLEKHFDKLQKTLSDIFGSVNSINLTLTNITQVLNSNVQIMGGIQKNQESNHNETLQIIRSLEIHLNSQDSIAEKNKELFESKIECLMEQNDSLKKQLKTNRAILIVGFIVILIAFIIASIKL